MESLDQYAFMEMIPESEAVAQGINLSDRFVHAVYKAVRNYSDPAHAKRRSLFTLDTEVPDLNQIARKDLAHILKKLISEKILIQLVRLDFQEGDVSPTLKPCFVGFSEDDRNHVPEIYSILLENSVESLEKYIKSRPAFQQDAYWKELELDLKSEKTLDAENLPICLIDFFKTLNPAKFDIPPHSDLIPRLKKDIESELLVRKRIVKLSMYGHMPVRDDEIGPRFNVAADFLQSKIIPRYRTRGDLKRILEEIALEEANYYLDEFAPQSATFSTRRAQAIHDAIGTTKTKDPRYPGALTIDILMGLEPRASDIFREKKRSENSKLLSEVKGRLLNPRAAWDDMILYLEDGDYESLPPEVRKGLEDDKKILSGTWEQPGNTIHVFLRNDPYAFRTIVAGMNDVTSDDSWKVLAVRHLLDKYDEHFEDLFQDPDFLRVYGKLLRTVYVNYMPLLFRILFMFGIHLFQDSAFASAKRAIADEQGRRALKNREYVVARKKRKEEEKKKALARFEEKTITNRILERLDDFYFEKLRVPSIMDVYSSISEKEENPEAFRKLLKKDGFQILPARKGETPDDALLLYPMDHEWRVRAARLLRNLERFKEETEKAGGEDYEKKLLLDRTYRVIKHINENRSASSVKVSGAGPKTDSKSPGSDPYEELKKEMDKQDENSIELSESDESAELDL